MKPIMDVNTYVVMNQWADLLVVIIMLIGLIIAGFYYIQDKWFFYKLNKKHMEKLKDEPNVFEEFTRKPKSEKERIKDIKEDF